MRLDAEVVIIGGGGAGLPASLQAVENGAKTVIILEKRKNTGGKAANASLIVAKLINYKLI